MSIYYLLSDISNEKEYYLGTLNAAKDTLPLLLLDLESQREVILYGDEIHDFLVDKYEDFERIYYDTIPNEKNHLSELMSLSRDEFTEFFERYSGNVLSVEYFNKELKLFKNKH